MKRFPIYLALFYLGMVACSGNYRLSRNNASISKDSILSIINLISLCDDYSFYKPDSALIFGYQAIQSSKKNNYKSGEGFSKYILGKVYLNLGNYSKSLELYNNALKIYDGLKDGKGQSSVYLLLGNLFFLQNDFKQAFYYLNKSEEFSKPLKIYNVLARVYLSKGQVFEKLNRWDSALFWIQKSNDLANTNQVFTLHPRIYLEKGNILYKQKKYNQALHFYRLSVDSSIKSDLIFCAGYLGLAKVYLDLGKGDSSLFYSNGALEIAQRNHQPINFIDASVFLKGFYKKLGKYDSAYKYQEIAHSASDSLFSREKINRFFSQDFEEKIRNQESRAQEEKAQSLVRFYITLSGLLMVFLISVILFWNNLEKQKVNARLLAQKNEIDEQRIKIVDAFENLKSTQNQLVQAEKMASLGELTMGIAHEIQNPLNFINNFSQVNQELAEEMELELDSGNLANVRSLTGEIIENNQRISFHGNRAGDIIKSMLQYSGRNNTKAEPTNMNILIRECLESLESKIKLSSEKLIDIIPDLDETIPEIIVSRQDMGSVLLNILNNSLFALGEKQKKGIQHYNAQIHIKTRIANQKLSILIRDNGTGIPDKILNKIFQPFFTTKPTGQGTGLGLSLSYDIAKAYGGEIEVQSLEGEWTEFVLWFPLPKNT